MSKSIVKPKTTLMWSEQIEKLKKRFSPLTDNDLYFEHGKMEDMLRKRLLLHTY